MTKRARITSFTSAADTIIANKKLADHIDEVNEHVLSQPPPPGPPPPPPQAPPSVENVKSLDKQIDRCCRWLFPLSFVIFNIIYWLIY